ncbi:MAG: hypothetical protein H0U36_00850, partial [Nocardioidaceae bacterium]|nr:hypothetical protein [Nocardioidaceae bacterium]
MTSRRVHALVATATLLSLTTACTSDPSSAADETPAVSMSPRATIPPPARTAPSQTASSRPSAAPTRTPSLPTQEPPAPQPPRALDPVTARVQRMSLRDRARQLLVVGLHGTTAPSELIGKLHPGGLIYFSTNTISTPQIATLSREAQHAARAAGEPLLLMTD